MAQLRRFGPTDFMVLLLILAVAAGVRIGYLMTCADGVRNAGPLRVQDRSPLLCDFEAPEDMRGAPRPTEQDALIDNVKNHQWFGCLAPFAAKEEQTAHVSPGYPYLVGLLATILPDDNLDSTIRWLQCALGSLTAGLYYLFARRSFHSLTVGVVAGLLAAINPYWVIGTATIDDGTLATFLLALALFLGNQAGAKGGALLSFAFGLTLGGLALVRAALLPFSFAALIWFLLRSRSLASGWLAGLLSFLGFAIALGPWTARNVQVFEEPIPVVDSAYLHLWVGNNPDTTGGPATEMMWRHANGKELRQVSSQPERYAKLGEGVWEQIRESPGTAVNNRLKAALCFLVGQHWLAEGTLAEVTPEGKEDMPDWLAGGHGTLLAGWLLGLLLLAFIGWRWSYGWRWESMPGALAMLWIPLPYILGHAEGLSGPRLPLDGVLICYAAFAICAVMPNLGGWLLDAPDAGQTEPQEEG